MFIPPAQNGNNVACQVPTPDPASGARSGVSSLACHVLPKRPSPEPPDHSQRCPSGGRVGWLRDAGTWCASTNHRDLHGWLTDISTSAILHRPLATHPPGGGEEAVGSSSVSVPGVLGPPRGRPTRFSSSTTAPPSPPHSCPQERPDSLVQQLRHSLADLLVAPYEFYSHTTSSSHRPDLALDAMATRSETLDELGILPPEHWAEQVRPISPSPKGASLPT